MQCILIIKCTQEDESLTGISKTLKLWTMIKSTHTKVLPQDRLQPTNLHTDSNKSLIESHVY